jgi:hypothetical protein
MEWTIQSRAAVMGAIFLMNCVAGTVFADSAKIWAKLSSPASGIAAATSRIIDVSPAVKPAAAAALLASSPVGARGLSLTGFAEDITAYDRLKIPGSRIVYRSPWLDIGTARIKTRLGAWLAAYRKAGGTADFVIIRPPAAVDVQRFAAIHLTGIKAIAADRRASSLAAEMGLASVLEGAKPTNLAAWRRGMQVRCDKAVEEALVAPVAAHFPAATITCIRSGAIPAEVASALGVASRGGAALGTADFATLRPAKSVGGFAGAKSVVGRIRSAVAASDRGLVPIMQSKSDFDIAVGTRVNAAMDGYWTEAAIHVSMSGVKAVVVSETALALADERALGLARTSLNAGAADTSLTPILLSAPTEADQVIASGMKSGALQVWRLTLPAGMTSASFQLADGTIATVRPATGECGAWFVAKSPAVPVLNSSRTGLVLAPDPMQNASQFVLISDGSPTSSFVSPVGYDSRYLIVYQNNADPQAMVTGVIDPAKVIAEIRRIQSTGVRSSWGVLDFEVPFDEVLMKGPSDPRFPAVSESLVNTMTAVKAAFPNMQWTYYGFPHVPYHPAVGDWGRVAASDRDALLQRYTEPYAAVLDSMDWFMPCAYDVYERAKGMPNTPSRADVAEVEFRKARVESIVRHFTRRSLPVPRIIPAVSPWFQPGAGDGAATWLAPIPTDEFIADQLRPCMEAGASGFAIWGSMDYFLRIASLQNPPRTNGVPELQAKFRTALGAAYPQAAGSAMPATTSSIDWSNSTALTLLGAQMNSTLAEALRSSDRVASEFGLAKPPARGTTISQK